MQDGHEFKGYLPGGPSGGILPASMADIPLDFGTLEKYGCFVGSHAVVILSDKDDIKAAALNLMQVLRGRKLRSVHALPRRDRESGQADGQGSVGREAAGRAVDRHARCVDLWAGPGGAESAVVCFEIFS